MTQVTNWEKKEQRDREGEEPPRDVPLSGLTRWKLEFHPTGDLT